MPSPRDQRLARAAAPAEPPELLAEEARVRALVADVESLDAEIDAIAEELGAFERAYAAATAAAFDELRAAERLERRVRRLLAEVERLRAGNIDPSSDPPRPRRAGERVGERGTVEGEGEGRARGRGRDRGRVLERPAAAHAADVTVIDPGELDLKRLHRRLARRLHPDLAREEGDRERAGALMALVNDAYARGDRAALELVAERLGAGEPAGEVEDEARRDHLARRAAALEDARAELAAERARLLSSGPGRLRAAALARAAEGRDPLAEAREAALSHAAAARARSLSSFDDLAAAARALAPVRPPGAAAPLASGGLVRAAAPTSERRPSHAARALARTLIEDAARPEPWAASLSVLAFLGEAAGIPPDALAARAALEERWDALRTGWSSAPDLGGALARLPMHLELGLRFAGDAIVAGLQLADPELAAAVRLALGAEPVRALARRALAVLGPRERCAACGCAVYAVHLLRARGLDEIHALACPRCAAPLRTFWRYGAPEGLAALAPLAVEVGALSEVEVRFARAPLAFGLLPLERARFTVGDLDRRLRELLLAPHGLEPPPGAIVYRVAGGAKLARGAALPRGRALTASLARAAPGAAAALVEAVRARVARRFRG
jgi:hypothetical protein